jgi:hypothetical protein
VAKNPVALDDNFLRLFLNLSTAILCTLSQFAQFVLPGRNPMPFYIW